MRIACLPVACLVACSQPAPVQDPLDYLRIGVDPRAEANAIMTDLTSHGFAIGRRIEEPDFVAFDAARGPDSTVRIITTRGTALSIQVPDVRWPERLWVELAGGSRPDFDGDGRGDVVVAIRERDRTCLAWARVDAEGFVAEVFRASAEWGDAPCLVEIDTPRATLELDVPDAPVPGARVRVPVVFRTGWLLDRSPAGQAHFKREIEARSKALEESELQGDTTAVERLRAELAWLEQLRSSDERVLEPAGDGETAR